LWENLNEQVMRTWEKRTELSSKFNLQERASYLLVTETQKTRRTFEYWDMLFFIHSEILRITVIMWSEYKIVYASNFANIVWGYVEFADRTMAYDRNFSVELW
jgi:hypothetical protein